MLLEIDSAAGIVFFKLGYIIATHIFILKIFNLVFANQKVPLKIYVNNYSFILKGLKAVVLIVFLLKV